MVAFLDYLPRGNALSDSEFKVRHHFLQWVLLLHLPALLIFGLFRDYSLNEGIEAIAAPAAFLVLSRMLRSRRFAGLALTAGLSSCSAALVVLSGGAIEAHFHFFATIGFIALYQDWVPFLWNALFTVFSHGIGSGLLPDAFFAHTAGQHHPWTWGLIHGIAVLGACIGVMLLLNFTENDHRRTVAMRAELVEGNRRRFTADLLVNLARRNQNLIYRQLELLNRLEDHERDAEQLSHLFQLDHLATRIRRNAESLLVLSGEEPARKWGGSVLLVDVVRAAIAEIEELDRVDFSVDESLRVSGRAVADATHLLAELIENAVHFSPPGLSVMVRTRPYLPEPGAQVLTIEDWGVGMTTGDLADANDLLRRPREVDLASAQRLGLHVVTRLAGRYGIRASLESTPGGGVTAVVMLPAELFTPAEEVTRTPVGAGVGGRPRPFGGDGPAGAARNGTPVLAGPGSGPGSSGPGSNGGASRVGPGGNGSGPNGSTPNGSGSNGSGFNGSGLNGSGLNGSGLNGPGLNGSGLNGPGLNGPGATAAGATAAGATAAGTNGAGVTGSGLIDDLNGWGLNGAGTGLLDSPTPNGSGPHGSGPNGDLAGYGPSGPGSGTGLLDGLEPGGRPAGGLGLESRNPGETLNSTTYGPAEPTGRLGRSSDPEALLGDDLDELGRDAGHLGHSGSPDSPLPAPLPAPRGDRPGRTAREDSWSTWWPLPAVGDTGPGAPAQGHPAEGSPAAGVPAPGGPAPGGPAPGGPAPGGPALGGPALDDGSLLRRTPQANLADELRRDDEDAARTPVRARRDPAETRSALSRFQATQRAAREGREPGTGRKDPS